MAITLRQLVATPHLQTRLLAGAGGIDRMVTWAHVCELPDPTEWMGGGELVMTVGLAIPPESQDQAAYIQRLAKAGLVGVAIGENMSAPPLSAAMLETAEGCALPILMTAYEVPFTTIARAVMDANQGEEHARFVQTVRVYDTVRHAIGNLSGATLLEQLGRVVECDLDVLDPTRGRSLYITGAGAVEPLAAEVQAALSGRLSRATAKHLRVGARPAIALPIPASRPAVLVAVARTATPPDLAVLRHVATVAALEIERATVDRERRRRLGAELLAALIDGRIEAGAATLLLAERGLAGEPGACIACAYNVGDDHADLHLWLEDLGLPHLLLRRSGELVVLLPTLEEAISALCAELGTTVTIGVSEALGDPRRGPDAYREAHWAVQTARTAGMPLVRHGEATAVPLPARSLGESQRLVQHVLGPVLEYDRAHGAQLLTTLDVFLAHNRSWQRAAGALRVHKQTLVYRIGRIQHLTGRHLDHTQDVAELWLALRAAQAIGILPAGAPPGRE
jgi:purine catabolism regulator